ncbi:helix-turn-helix domain-containing protein [Massilia sp. TS11]|nr:YdaS family helix-turn-helix protein [Massilia sp. TS11]MCG2586524.1 helix-turn-helix domain-containing protein [Massilia sp. TS11]
MDTSKIISLLGGTAKTAELCQVTPGAVSQWLHSGIPAARLMYLRAIRPEVFKDEDAPNTEAA